MIGNPRAEEVQQDQSAAYDRPDLYQVTKRRDEAWLTRWLKNPEQTLAIDATAKQLLDKYKVPMPNQNLSDQEIREYVAYFRWADANVRPQGTTQPQPAAPGTALPPSQTLSAPGPGDTLERRSTTEKGGGAGAKGSSR